MLTAWLLSSGVAHAGIGPEFRSPRGCVVPQGAAAARLPLRPAQPELVPLASAVRPVIVWYDPAHPNSAIIAPEVLAVLELSWDVQVDEIGFRAPILPDTEGGPELDVYLVDYARFSAFVAADDYRDRVTGDGLNSTSAYMVVDRELPTAFVPAWVSHEFNHVLQYATDFSEPSLPIWEATATAAQDWTVGEAGRWDYDVPTFQEIPFAPVLTGDAYRLWPMTGAGATYEYGAALWVMALDRLTVAGAPGAGAVALWEAAANEGIGREPDVADAVAEVAGADLGTALNGFARARFLTGPDWDERGLPDASGWGPGYAVPTTAATGADLPLDPWVPQPAPMITGQAFLDVALAGGVPAADGLAEPWVVVSAASGSGLHSAVWVATWGAAGATDVGASGPDPEVAFPLAGVERIVVALTNLGPAEWDADENAYVEGDQTVSVRIEDRGAPAGTTPPTDTGAGGTPPPPGDPDPADPKGDGEGGGCSCTAPGSGGPATGVAWALLPMVLALRARARRSLAVTGRAPPKPAAGRLPAAP